MMSTDLKVLCWIACTLVIAGCQEQTQKYKSWEITGGSKEGIRYSSLSQIDTNNVAKLHVAWTYHTGDADTINNSQMQCNPIVVDGVLYATSPTLKLVALDAFTGKRKWIFDPRERHEGLSTELNFILNNNRGVTYWAHEDEKRIFYSVGGFLLSIDATTGVLDKNFGDNGRVDLHKDLGRDVDNLYVASTSPAIVYKNLVIVGTRVSENSDAAPGHIRAYDAVSGKMEWIFHTIPQPGEFGFDTWKDAEAWKHIGGANSWAGFTLDETRGILFAPTGSASFDFYGGMRRGDNLFSDCILALDAATGKRIWHFQNIHHDVWDKDLPTAPALVTVEHDGKKIDAVAQPTKTGFIFLLERSTGRPLFPIEERQVPFNTKLGGEELSRTQPFPTLPQAFTRQAFSEDDINDLLPDSSREEVRRRFLKFNRGNMFEPPSKEGTIFFPGLDGGAEWGGPAFDPETGVMFVNANEVPWVITIAEVLNKHETKLNYFDAGKMLYMKNCIACHGPDLQGSGNYPALTTVGKKYSAANVIKLLSTGRRMMPAFGHLSAEQREAIAAFVLKSDDAKNKTFLADSAKDDYYQNLPYTITGYNKFESTEGYPAIKPPWGTLSAVSLNTGKIVWRIPLGSLPEFKRKGIDTGAENYGGPVVTKGGLVFIAATADKMLRAFNKRNGKLLWQYELPFAAFSTPAMVELNGQQFLIVACGGGRLGATSGDVLIAFALPEQ